MRPTILRQLAMTVPRLEIKSLPRPKERGWGTERVAPEQAFLPLEPHPGGQAPSVPSRPPYALPKGWKATDKTLPAAYPRTLDLSTGDLVRESFPKKYIGPAGEIESKENRVKRMLDEAFDLIKTKYKAIKEGHSEGQKGLWIAGQKWAREKTTPGAQSITLVVTHANGLHKEAEADSQSWFPTFKRFVEGPALLSPATFGSPSLPVAPGDPEKKYEVDTIWFLDDMHHGASIDVNKGLIGPAHSWIDGGRDVVAVIESEVEKGQLVVGVGHSFGGNGLVHAAHARPDLFAGLFLVEPMLRPIYTPPEVGLEAIDPWILVQLAYKRRGTWPNIEAAASSRNSPFFGPWHDEVWDLWLSHAIVPHPDGGVQLATPIWGEAAVFAEPEGLGGGWDKLPDTKVPIGFVMAGDTSALGGDDVAEEVVWRAPIVANEQFIGAGHLTVQERPVEVADALRRFLGNLFLAPGERGKL